MQPVTAQVTETIRADDARLVQRACAGDADAFDAIARDRLPGAFRLASAVLGSEADAADATQNALLAAWRQLPQLRDVDRFDAWFHRILVNECRMSVRRQPTRGEVELVVDDASTIDTTPFDHDEVMFLLAGAFEALDADDRILVVLHHLENRPFADVAAIVQMPLETVERRLSEARKVLHGASTELLRQMLERRAEVPPPAWLLPSVAQAVRATTQARAGARSIWSLPRRRGERLVFLAAAVALVLAVVVGAMVAGGLVRTHKPPLPADIIVPSSSGTGPSDVPSASSSPPASESEPSSGPRHPTVPAAVVAAWALPPGWRFGFDCDEDRCFLSLFDATDRRQDGWPVAVPGECGESDITVGPDDSVFLECDSGGRAVVIGLDRAGKALPGWPVKLKGPAVVSTWNDLLSAYGSNTVAVGPDATVYVAAATKGKGSYAIHALAPDGQERTGWPVALAGDGQGFAVAPNGTIVAWWYEGYEEAIQLEARRTVFTEIGKDGKVLPGWPKGSVGAASGPVVWEDGSIFYVSESGKVWGHDPRGDIIDGWPYQLKQPVAPTLRGDGTFMFIEDSRVVVLDRNGKAVPGWPYRANGAFVSLGCDTGGYSMPLALVADDGTVYLAPWDGTRSSIVALRADGATVDGWPYDVPAGWRVTDLLTASDGGLEAGVAVDRCETGLQSTSIKLSPQGVFLGDPLPTPLTQVYDALRLNGLRTPDGKDTFGQGGQLDFEVELRNRSDRSIELPRVQYDDQSVYAAGALRTWIMPLTDDKPALSCLTKVEDDDSGWYATGGEIVVSSDPLTIRPGAGIETPLSIAVTDCLPPGDYRYRVEYVRLSDLEDAAMDEATLEFTITPRGPVVTPSPSPVPRPTRTPTLPTPPPTGSTTPSPS